MLQIAVFVVGLVGASSANAQSEKYRLAQYAYTVGRVMAHTANCGGNGMAIAERAAGLLAIRYTQETISEFLRVASLEAQLAGRMPCDNASLGDWTRMMNRARDSVFE